MRLSKSKEAIVETVRGSVANYLKYNVSVMVNDYDNLVTIKSRLSDLVANAVAEGIRVAFENMYTDEDFEKDLTLKK